MTTQTQKSARVTATLYEMKNGEAKYVECSEAEVPEDVRFDTPRSNQGQDVEVSYGDLSRFGSENGAGDPWKRVIDHQTRRTTYYRLTRTEV